MQGVACVMGPSAPHARIVDGCLQLQFDSNNAGFEGGQRALHEFLEAEGVSARGLYQTELAFEELVINVIRHGFGDHDAGAHPIDVSVCVRGGDIVLTVEDDGPPFNPLEAPDPPAPTTLEEAKIGGLGLPLVRFAAKRIEYQRIAGRNRVILSIQSP
jgi:serine/threonine-protein kinase RsbW